MIQKTRILVTDDESDIRFFLVETLTQQGYDVLEASSGEEALRCLRKEKIDLVILDLKMPGMNGLQVVEQMEREKFSADLILLTAYGSLDVAVRLLRHGHCDFLKKPCATSDLLESVERMLSYRRENQKRERALSLLSEAVRQLSEGEVEEIAPGYKSQRYLEDHGLILDRSQERASRDGKILPLTRTEYRLLAHLMERQGELVRFAEMYRLLFSAGEHPINERDARQALSTHIWRLRQKLGNDPENQPYIASIHGGGYRFISSSN